MIMNIGVMPASIQNGNPKPIEKSRMEINSEGNSKKFANVLETKSDRLSDSQKNIDNKKSETSKSKNHKHIIKKMNENNNNELNDEKVVDGKKNTQDNLKVDENKNEVKDVLVKEKDVNRESKVDDQESEDILSENDKVEDQIALQILEMISSIDTEKLLDKEIKLDDVQKIENICKQLEEIVTKLVKQGQELPKNILKAISEITTQIEKSIVSLSKNIGENKEFSKLIDVFKDDELLKQSNESNLIKIKNSLESIENSVEDIKKIVASMSKNTIGLNKIQQNKSDLLNVENVENEKNVDSINEASNDQLENSNSNGKNDSEESSSNKSNASVSNEEINSTKSSDNKSESIVFKNITESSDIDSKESVVSKDKLERNILKQIQENAKLNLKNGKQEIKMLLKPEKLGELTLKVQIHKGQLFAKAFVQNETVKNALESQFQELKQMFQNQGYKQVDFNVETQKQNLQQNGQGFNEKQKEQTLYFSKKIAKNRMLTKLNQEWESGGYVPHIYQNVSVEGLDITV